MVDRHIDRFIELIGRNESCPDFHTVKLSLEPKRKLLCCPKERQDITKEISTGYVIQPVNAGD
jgi:hypothetical protein